MRGQETGGLEQCLRRQFCEANVRVWAASRSSLDLWEDLVVMPTGEVLSFFPFSTFG